MRVVSRWSDFSEVGIVESNNPVYDIMNKIRDGLSDYLTSVSVQEESHPLVSCSLQQAEDTPYIDKTTLRPFLLTLEGPKSMIKHLDEECRHANDFL